ncbi:MAG: hypothetical protein ABFQ82_01615 [Thermodesulfobacteriota bacterium]
MRWCLLLLALISQLYGCGAGLQGLATLPALHPDRPSLWQVNIGEGESAVFTGLLVLKPEGDVLRAVLLDSMGIKLLEEKIGRGGEVEIVSGIEAVTSRRLPAFLGEGIHRLFFSPGPQDGKICRSDGIVAKVCLGEKGVGHLVKLRRTGPFVLWSVDYFINNYDSFAEMTGARLDSGWFVPSLHLKKKDMLNGATGDAAEDQ